MTRAHVTRRHRGIAKAPLSTHTLQRTSAPDEIPITSKTVGYEFVSTTAHYTRLPVEFLRKIATEVIRCSLQTEDDA
ncbi:hypothetical protein Lysil_0500 [Lysobacter silvestris]|uniref:Uncharacterized protein n=1 Tax=Solilutibacter silvestris TaxID=1645665 RepID=A0A2K1Q1F9_9GAMM|nr:hypothetical protein Lysil_0500 [Lysobacter silvestris]